MSADLVKLKSRRGATVLRPLRFFDAGRSRAPDRCRLSLGIFIRGCLPIAGRHIIYKVAVRRVEAAKRRNGGIAAVEERDAIRCFRRDATGACAYEGKIYSRYFQDTFFGA